MLQWGEGTWPWVGALPCSYTSLEGQCFGGPVAPFPPPDLRCLPIWTKKSSADAVAFINSMWHQSTTALGPPRLQAGFHNLSKMPDLLLGQEVMHSRSLPTLEAYWLWVGKSKIRTVWPWQGTSSHSHHRSMLFFVFIKKFASLYKKARITLKSVYELSE